MSTQYKSYKFRIYPTPEQEQYFTQCFGAKRFIYNHFLWENKTRFQNKEKLGRGVEQWTCPECNTFHDRDINAAINIRNQGQTDLYDQIIPKQQGNWDQEIPAVLQKLIDKIERSSEHNSGVNQGSKQVNQLNIG